MVKDKIKFIKRNYIVFYSLILISVIVGVVFFGNYYSLKKFQYNTDRLLQSKASLAEDIFNITTADNLGNNSEEINKNIERILEKDSEVKKIEIAIPVENSEKYEIIASSDKSVIGNEIDNDLIRIASSNDTGVAFLNNDKKGRYWEIIKSIKNSNMERLGVLSFQMSLVEHDNFINDSIQKVYIVLALLMLLVLLVIANHVRFFNYALKATKLEEVDKMKDDFISMASHELKSPLTSIKGYIEILKEKIKNDEKSKDDALILKNIDSSVSRLNDLVTDLLEVSRLEQNRLPVKIENIDLNKVISDSIAELSVNAKNKKLDLVYLKTDKAINVMADEKRVKQILVNLLSNAIKYTPQGKVEIILKEGSNKILVTIADTGLGISAKNMKNLFSKFYRVQTSETAKISGTGLGLWISREIARKMEGELTVESIEGVGSHFTLELKKAK
jgi:signal transduction histidine kinase